MVISRAERDSIQRDQVLQFEYIPPKAELGWFWSSLINSPRVAFIVHGHESASEHIGTSYYNETEGKFIALLAMHIIRTKVCPFC